MTARPPRAPQPAMLTVAQAADRLGIHRQQVYAYIYNGLLRATQYPTRTGKPNGPLRIDPADVERFIQAHLAVTA